MPRTATTAPLSLLLTLLLGLALGLGVLVPPATGAPAPAAGAPAMAAPAAEFKPWGRTRAPDQVLRKGCRGYKYHYAVKTPGPDWTAEIFLIGPGGRRLAHAAYFPASDPAVDNQRWRICRASTKPGRFKMRMRVTWYDGYDNEVAWVKPSWFRLVRPR